MNRTMGKGKERDDAPLKSNMHPRNRHRGRYDFDALIQTFGPLKNFVRTNPYGDLSVDFADPSAVKALNKALLIHFYSIEVWDIPDGYLCPPIPGRADYIHHVADLLVNADGSIPRGPTIRCLDVGVGANCIYPIIARSEYDWSIVGVDADQGAVKSAQAIVSGNSILRNDVEIRVQHDPKHTLCGILQKDEKFDAVVCNPPFHASQDDARAGTERKLRNLNRKKGKKPNRFELNFSGKTNELCYDGGEVGFVSNLIDHSKLFASSCRWYTSLVSKASNVKPLVARLKAAEVKTWRTIDMGQGNKKSRILAWSFIESESTAGQRDSEKA